MTIVTIEGDVESAAPRALAGAAVLARQPEQLGDGVAKGSQQSQRTR